MGNLDNHFGENAGLDATVSAEILAYLDKNAAYSRGVGKVMGFHQNMSRCALLKHRFGALSITA
jgi:hypothetical protein